MDKVPFSEAAKLAGIHPNTIRNWRKAGKLKSAEKVLENGIEVWIIDPSEVSQVALQPRASTHDNNPNTVNISDVNPTPTNAPIAAGFEQSLIFMRESVVKPLTDLVERQSNQIKEMSEEIGTLKERLRALEAAQAARVPEPAPQPATPAPIVVQPVETAQNAPQPQPRRGWLARLFGG